MAGLVLNFWQVITEQMAGHGEGKLKADTQPFGCNKLAINHHILIQIGPISKFISQLITSTVSSPGQQMMSCQDLGPR